MVYNLSFFLFKIKFVSWV